MKKFFLYFTISLLLKTGSLFSQETRHTDTLITPVAEKWIQEQTANGKEISQESLDSLNRALIEMKCRTDTSQLHPRRIRKTSISGSSLTVPEGKLWKIIKVSVSSGTGGYKLHVKSRKFGNLLIAGEKLYIPTYSVESSLISNGDATSLMYTFEIDEYDFMSDSPKSK